MPFGGGMEIAMQNENGEWVDVPGEVAEEIFGSMGGNVIGYSPADPVLTTFAENNPVSIVAGILIFVGVVMIVGGIILAWYLYRLGKETK